MNENLFPKNRFRFYPRMVGAVFAHVCSRLLIKVLKVNVCLSGFSLNGVKGALIVANHVSTVDILLISGFVPSIFVTSTDVGKNIITGPLALAGGSLFVDRRSLKTLRRDLKTIASLLAMGNNVVVFPEATSTDNSTVLPFKPALFEAARMACAPVIAIAFRYEMPKLVGYYGEMAFAAHIKNLFSARKIKVSMECSDFLSFELFSAREMAEQARKIISKMVSVLSLNHTVNESETPMK